MAWTKPELNFPEAAGGCPQCGGSSNIPVTPPAKRLMFSDPGPFSASLARDAAEFAAPHRPCPTCRPAASAAFIAEAA